MKRDYGLEVQEMKNREARNRMILYNNIKLFHQFMCQYKPKDNK
jgi:hypothetical protein